MLDAMKASRIDLPLCAPIYSVSHGQGSVTSILHDNISLRNWYLNNSMVLSVRDGNPGGLFRPNIDICQSGPEDNPYIERQEILLTFLDGAVCRVIKNMINKGYYVYFGAIDDSYPIKQQEFLMGCACDTYILCFNKSDSVRYIRRTIKYLESIFPSKVLCLCLNDVSAKANKLTKVLIFVRNYLAFRKRTYYLSDKVSLERMGELAVKYYAA